MPGTSRGNWRWARLRDVCETTSGGTPSRSVAAYYNGSIPWVKSGELNDGPIFQTQERITEAAVADSSAKSFPSGTLLIALYGATVGRLGILRINAATNQAICAIFPNEDVARDFLFFYLLRQRDNLIESRTGGAQPNISQSTIRNLPILLPPLPEQKRIAAILAKADRLRRLRRTARDFSDTYLQSVFVHIFGDPSSNPKEWDVVPIEKVLSKDRGGTRTGPFGSSLKRNEYVEQGIPVWGIDNVRENEFVEAGSLFITPSKYSELPRYTVEDGDILISRAGTVGRMCVARPEQYPSIIGTNLVRVTLDTSAVLPEYFTALFTYFAGRVGRLSSGGTAYSFINPRTLKSLEIPFPPLALQQKFAHIVHKFERLRAQQREAERQAEHLFQTLLHRAFRGEL